MNNIKNICMEKVFFNPRIGKNYNIGGYNNLKILILGESHYCESECEECGRQSNSECSNFTINVLERYFAYIKGTGVHEDWMRTFTRFTNVFFNERVSADKLLDFWDSVVFYNYVQSSTDGPRSKPSSQQFSDSKDAFFEVLKECMPDLIIVWGVRLWENLPNNGKWGNEYILDNESERFYFYEIEGKCIPAYCVYHPSTSYFNYEYSNYFKEVIRLVSKTK